MNRIHSAEISRKRWTVNGTGKYKDANCAYWNAGDTPWPPAAGWQAHPDWTKTIAVAGGFGKGGGEGSNSFARAVQVVQAMVDRVVRGATEYFEARLRGDDAGLRKVEVGRVMSWFDYRARAEAEGGRLPTTAELRAASVDVGYDQWTPITACAHDQQTGRIDGVRADGENLSYTNSNLVRIFY